MPAPPVRTDEQWLLLAVEESRRCAPSATAFSVGTVVVDRSGRELARGHSRQGGDPRLHAEEAALAGFAAGDPRLAGATVYTSLEPCTERRSAERTCTELIVRSGAARVVLAWREPALLVADCRGVELLAASGLDVVEMPALAASAAAVNAHLVGR